MKDVRFGWLGESRRASTLSLISGEVAEWSQDWWIDHAPAEVDVHWIEHRRFTTQGSMPFASIGSSGSLAMFMGSKGLDGIGRYLAGTVDEEESGWAQRIGEEALEDLAARVYRRAGVAKPSPLSAHAAPSDVARADLGSGVVAIVLGSIGVGFGHGPATRGSSRATPGHPADWLDVAPVGTGRRDHSCRSAHRFRIGQSHPSVGSSRREVLVGDRGLRKPCNFKSKAMASWRKVICVVLGSTTCRHAGRHQLAGESTSHERNRCCTDRLEEVDYSPGEGNPLDRTKPSHAGACQVRLEVLMGAPKSASKNCSPLPRATPSSWIPTSMRR